MHYLAMVVGAMLICIACVLRFFRQRKEKRQKEIEQAHTDALEKDSRRKRNAEERAKIDRIIDETEQMMAQSRESWRLEEILRQWHARGGWVHGAPPPEVWELLPGWKLSACTPREDN